MCEALDCVSVAAALCALLSKFSHGVTLLIKLNIESMTFAGVGSGHFSSSVTTQLCSLVMSLCDVPKVSFFPPIEKDVAKYCEVEFQIKYAKFGIQIVQIMSEIK